MRYDIEGIIKHMCVYIYIFTVYIHEWFIASIDGDLGHGLLLFYQKLSESIKIHEATQVQTALFWHQKKYIYIYIHRMVKVAPFRGKYELS